MAKILNRLDLMIAYSCNLSCVGCISLSDFQRDGIAPFQDIVCWIEHWSKLVSPKVITIFGGEPCLHPRLPEICLMVRNNWPTATIRLITNGYLLDNFKSDVWFQYSPMEIQVSIHRQDHEDHVNQRIKNILLNRKDWKTEKNPTTRHEQISWSSGNFKIYKSVFKEFIVPFKNTNGNIAPWRGNAVEAHKICGSPDSPVLYKGKLYKCPAVANTLDLTGENWFGYEPCVDSKNLDQFIASIGHPEIVCGQCPDLAQAVRIDHFDIKNVTIKQKNIS